MKDTLLAKRNCQTVTPDISLNQLKIGFHNINGIKGNKTKLQELMDFGIEENLDIIGLTETNTNTREAIFFEVNWGQYRAFWTKSII